MEAKRRREDREGKEKRKINEKPFLIPVKSLHKSRNLTGNLTLKVSTPQVFDP